nr:hypothetical protein [Methanobrevibacter smithii]
MSINDLQKYKQTIMDNFRSIKLEKDYAQFQLLQFQLMELIYHYKNLINLQEEIQSKHYQTIKQLKSLNLIDNYDYVKWHQNKSEEISLWKKELELLTEYKYQINNILENIENGTAKEMLIKQEKNLFD